MSEEGIIEYKESLKGCKCNSWCRADLPSGFNSVHHAGCDKFNPLKEMHIFSTANINQTYEIQSLKSQNEKLRECVEFYKDEKYLKEATSNNAADGFGTYRFDIDSGKKACECLKGVDGE